MNKKLIPIIIFFSILISLIPLNISVVNASTEVVYFGVYKEVYTTPYIPYNFSWYAISLSDQTPETPLEFFIDVGNGNGSVVNMQIGLAQRYSGIVPAPDYTDFIESGSNDNYVFFNCTQEGVITFHSSDPLEEIPPNPTSGGTLEDLGIYGEWDYAIYPNYIDTDLHRTNREGFAETFLSESVDFSIDNSGLNSGMKINRLTGNRFEWFWRYGAKSIAYGIDVKNGDEHIYSILYISHEQYILHQAYLIKAGTEGKTVLSRDSFTFSNVQAGVIGSTMNLTNSFLGTQIVRVNSTTAKVRYWFNYFIGFEFSQNDLTLGHLLYEEYFTVSETFWGDCDVYLSVWHDGNGYANFTMGSWTGLVFDDNGTVIFPDSTVIPFPDQQDDPLIIGDSEESDDWLTTAWNLIKGLYDIIINIWGIIINGFYAIIPYVPYLIMFYLIDAVIRSVHTRSFAPIGYVFLTGWSFLNNSIEWIIGLIRGIGELIPF